MVNLSKTEKREMCISLAQKLPEIRKLLHMSQKEFGARCGISSNRLSAIENGHFVMTWSQLTSIILICMVNKQTKEYFYANKLLNPRFFQYLQRKDENIPPELNILVNPVIVMGYEEVITLDSDPII
ncbi:MAG: helix-turn-helix transcriptional regulator [Clostridia bacterium]|nr:helix-turn-helix transcriptional regulator [Clostridia bacterium]